MTMLPASGTRPAPRQRRYRIGRRCLDLVMVIFLTASIGKLSSINAFADSLLSWSLIPRSLRPTLTLLVPVLELSIACSWFLRLSTRAAAVAAGSLLIMFTIVYAAHVLFARPPNCQCLAQIDAFWRGRGETQHYLARNSALLGLLVVGSCLTPGCTAQRNSSPPGDRFGTTPRDARSRAPSAFTLLETLICIVVVAVLLALALPAVRHFRAASRETGSLSNLRSHAQVFAAYASDFHDLLPYFTPPGSSKFVMPCATRGEVTGPHFGTHAYWNYGLADRAYGGNPGHDSFYPPGTQAFSGTDYAYACDLIAAPEYWNPSTRTSPEQWRPTALSLVRFPSAKVLMIDSVPIFRDLVDIAWRNPNIRLGAAFIDSSASVLGLDELVPGYEGGDGHVDGCIHTVDFPYGLHTLDGIRGRDIR
ncbi:MAG: prepilin-type N-terminal cleavage/methylation domain-containing protein [Phycisphaerae bacterium]|nr:prepilin-type N-terminal cleavage/methylation domain-containing protein [Phycisphaerae bacterium]